MKSYEKIRAEIEDYVFEGHESNRPADATAIGTAGPSMTAGEIAIANGLVAVATEIAAVREAIGAVLQLATPKGLPIDWKVTPPKTLEELLAASLKKGKKKAPPKRRAVAMKKGGRK